MLVISEMYLHTEDFFFVDCESYVDRNSLLYITTGIRCSGKCVSAFFLFFAF